MHHKTKKQLKQHIRRIIVTYTIFLISVKCLKLRYHKRGVSVDLYSYTQFVTDLCMFSYTLW